MLSHFLQANTTVIWCLALFIPEVCASNRALCASGAVGLCAFNFLRASNIDHCSGVGSGRFALLIGRLMEYRGIEYTVVRDEGGDWQWTVVLGNPETIKSGQAASKGTAILKVWAAIDRAHRRASWKSRPNVTGKEVPPQNRQGVEGHSVKPTSTP